MAKCTVCGKSGFFLSVNNRGWCSKCVSNYKRDAQSRINYVKSLENKYEQTNDPQQCLGLLEEILQHLEILVNYENVGLVQADPTMSHYHAYFSDKKRSMQKKILKEDESLPAICPYCGAQQSKWPKRQKKCETCKETMFLFIRENEKFLLTEDQAIEREWIDRLCQLAISEGKYNSRKKQFREKVNGEPKWRDVIWSLLNEKLNQLMQKSNFEKMSHVYSAMADFKYDEGKSGFQEARQANKMLFMSMRKHELFDEYDILCAGPKSAYFEGKTFTLEELRELVPIPCEEYAEECRHKCIISPHI